MADIYADVHKLWTTKAAFPTLSPGAKYKTQGYDDALKLLMMKDDNTDTIAAEWSADVHQVLLAANNVLTGENTFESTVYIEDDQFLVLNSANDATIRVNTGGASDVLEITAPSINYKSGGVDIIDLGSVITVYRTTTFNNPVIHLNTVSTTHAITSTLATGTAPLVIASTTLVSNLNADLWDGYQFADYLDQSVKQADNVQFNRVIVRDTNGPGELYVQGFEGNAAYIYVEADEGDDNADSWRISANTSGVFAIETGASGSYVGIVNIDASSNVNIPTNVIIGPSGTLESNMTTGLTVDQGSGDDLVLAFRSSDIDTGSTFLDADTYGAFRKQSGGYGGLEIMGYSEGGFAAGLFFRGVIAASSTFAATTFVVHDISDNPLGDTVECYNFTNDNDSLLKIYGNGDLRSTGGFYLFERSAANADVAAYGQFWIKDDSPNVPMFTDDAGNDHYIPKMVQGNFTMGATGLTTSPTATAYYTIVGSTVILMIPQITGTSNAVSFTLTGLPSVIQPIAARSTSMSAYVTDNGSPSVEGTASVSNSSIINLSFQGSAGGWTSSGTKAVNNCTIVYQLY